MSRAAVVGDIPGRVARAVRRRANGISRRRPSFARPISQACTYEQIRSAEYLAWCDRLQLPPLTHRKLWEWCYILRVLERGGMMRAGRRGLGFGVGTEPIASVLAAAGCTILATDQPATEGTAADWMATGQHAQRLADVNEAGLCPPDRFAANVEFAELDMNAISPDLRGFDFSWSSCAIEHLGELDAGLDFVERQLECLVPRGLSVHTTEYNVSSDDETIEKGHTVLYRRRDLEAFVTRMRSRGHRVTATFALGDEPQDLHVDAEPFSDVHLRTATDGIAHTSFGLIVTRSRRA